MKQMRQPRKDVLREQLALAAEEIIDLRTQRERDLLLFRQWQDAILAAQPRPWWRRLLGWLR